MSDYIKADKNKVIISRLSHGADLLKELTEICNNENIRLGTIEAIGAVQKAVIGYYEQSEHVYKNTEINEPMEILKLSGNISLKDEKPMVHAHITMAKKDGSAIGGHLCEGTVVFACEAVISVLDSEDKLERKFDEVTELALWDIK